MERGEKNQSKQQRKEIPTEQGSYSFFQSQVQGPGEVRPGPVEGVCLSCVRGYREAVDPRLLCDPKL